MIRRPQQQKNRIFNSSNLPARRTHNRFVNWFPPSLAKKATHQPKNQDHQGSSERQGKNDTETRSVMENETHSQATGGDSPPPNRPPQEHPVRETEEAFQCTQGKTDIAISKIREAEMQQIGTSKDSGRVSHSRERITSISNQNRRRSLFSNAYSLRNKISRPNY